MTRTPTDAEQDAIERAGAALAALGSCSGGTALCALGIAVSTVLNALPRKEREEAATRWISVLVHSLGWEVDYEDTWRALH